VDYAPRHLAQQRLIDMSDDSANPAHTTEYASPLPSCQAVMSPAVQHRAEDRRNPRRQEVVIELPLSN
jgi:hypothetical protein